MEYYKIPIVDGVFDYPAGCILCCAYPNGSYMYCKFESVASVGSNWVEITESEFDVRCPDFPVPEYSGEMESDDYPGCYYRMVDGEKEWRNPPMEHNQEYRTTERYHGEVVYVTSVTVSSLPEDATTSGGFNVETVIPLEAEITEVTGKVLVGGHTAWPLPAGNNEGIFVWALVSKARSITNNKVTHYDVNFRTIRDLEQAKNNSAMVTIKYVKP